MRVWRRIEKISWRDMKTNEDALQLVIENRNKSYRFDMEKEEKLDWSYTQR